MEVGAGLVVVMICWVVVRGVVGGLVGAGLLGVLDSSWLFSSFLIVVEGPGLLVVEVWEVGSWSKISKSVLVARVAVKEGILESGETALFWVVFQSIYLPTKAASLYLKIFRFLLVLWVGHNLCQEWMLLWWSIFLQWAHFQQAAVLNENTQTNSTLNILLCTKQQRYMVGSWWA